MLNRILRATNWADRLEFFDDEANPTDLDGWSGRLNVFGPLGAGTEVVNQTASPYVVVTEPFIDFAMAPNTIVAGGAYVVALFVTDAAGKESCKKRTVVYFE